jgi:Fe-S-cluster containining protein
MLIQIKLLESMDDTEKTQTYQSAPQLKACRECPSSSVCCSVATRGGSIESPYLLPSDVTNISGALGVEPEAFIERRTNTSTGNEVAFVKSNATKGCRFHDSATGRCAIYGVRPLDCRLFPLDIAYLKGAYHWILWNYCTITDDDLKMLLAFGNSILPLLAHNLRDYATVPIIGMERITYQIIAPIVSTNS